MKMIFNKFLISPQVSIILRKIVENNFTKEKQIIKKYFADIKGKILDLGCGTGEFSVFFSSENYVGIDIDSNNIKYASSHYKRTFQVADAKKLPFADGSFPNVLVIGVFHHLSDSDAIMVLEEIKRVMAPTGKLLIMEDTVSKNIFSKIINYFDQGKFIRTKEEWRKIFGHNFKINEEFSFRAGICFYSTFLLNN